MPRPSLEDRVYITSTQAAQRLGVSRPTLVRWIVRHILPPATVTKRNGVRLFSDDWLTRAKTTAAWLKHD